MNFILMEPSSNFSNFLPLIHFNKDRHSKCTEIYESLQAAQLNLTYSEKLYRKCCKNQTLIGFIFFKLGIEAKFMFLSIFSLKKQEFFLHTEGVFKNCMYITFF